MAAQNLIHVYSVQTPAPAYSTYLSIPDITVVHVHRHPWQCLPVLSLLRGSKGLKTWPECLAPKWNAVKFLSLSFCAVCDDHCFKDEKLFYRFRKDDGTYQEPANALVLAKGQRLYSRYVCVLVCTCVYAYVHVCCINNQLGIYIYNIQSLIPRLEWRHGNETLKLYDRNLLLW